MKMRTRMLALATSVVLMLALLAGCGNQAGGAAGGSAADGGASTPAGGGDAGGDTGGGGGKKKLVLSMPADEQEKKDAETAIERFEANYPDFEVEAQFTTGSWEELCEKIMIQLAAGEQLDVIRIAVEATQMMVANDVFMPLDDLVAGNETYEELKKEIPQAAWDCFVVDGVLYEIPADSNSMLLFYNKKMYEEAGLALPTRDYSWDQYVSDLKVLTKGEGDDKVWGTMFNIKNFPVTWVAANGVTAYSDDYKQSNLKDPKIKEALQNMYDLIFVHEVAPIPEQNDDPENMFAAGRVATVGSGTYKLATMEANNFHDWDVCSMPRMSAEGTDTFGVGGNGITSTCQYPEEALALCMELSSRTRQEEQAKAGTALPLYKSVAESEDFLRHCDNMLQFYEVFDYGLCLPAPIPFADAQTILNTLFANYLSGAQSIDEAIEQADAEMTGVVNKSAEGKHPNIVRA